MPGFNQRGPMNEGPMTGRQMGRCAGGYAWDTGDDQRVGWNAPGNRGMGMGRRRCQRPQFGLGMARRARAASSSREMLDLRARQLEMELEAIRNELKGMDDQ